MERRHHRTEPQYRPLFARTLLASAVLLMSAPTAQASVCDLISVRPDSSTGAGVNSLACGHFNSANGAGGAAVGNSAARRRQRCAVVSSGWRTMKIDASSIRGGAIVAARLLPDAAGVDRRSGFRPAGDGRCAGGATAGAQACSGRD
jgi:hypothetical protein